MERKKNVPGYTGEEHPEIVDIRAMPPQPEQLKPGQISENLIRSFFDEGYVLLDEFFEREEVYPCRAAIERLVDDLAEKLFKGGKIKNLYKEYSWTKRVSKIDEEFPEASTLLHKTGKLPQEFQNLWANEKLLNLMEQLLGPDISGMPSWNLRCLTPNSHVAHVPWHQDSGYTSTDAYGTLVVTVWIPFLDTNEKNGCLEIVPRAHRKGKVARHYGCVEDTWYIELPEQEMEDTLGAELTKSKVCPVPYGGLLMFSNFLPHRSLGNFTDDMRWSIDLRFKKTGLPNGSHGLKKDIELRSSRDPDLKVDWSTFASTERLKLKVKTDGSVIKNEEDEFDTTNGGPWIRKWEVTHHNRHTAKAWAMA